MTTESTKVRLAAEADCIVTENAKHFKSPYKTTKIVNARQLLEILKSQAA